MHAALIVFLAASPPATNITPFKTEVTPRVDAVFGDIAALRRSVDRFLVLQGEMEQIRAEFSTGVHSTLSLLARPSRQASKGGCPPGALAQYGRALVAGSRYLSLGRQLEARFREVKRAEDLGESTGLTPDYRVKTKKARDLYLELLRDYREMRVAFYDQLGAEMKHTGCPLPTLGLPANAPPMSSTASDRAGAPGADPSDPTAWDLEDLSMAANTPAVEATTPGAGRGSKTTPPPLSGAAPAIWIKIDNSHCAYSSTLTIDGVALGTVPGHKTTAVRTRAGPHEVCVLPMPDKRTCGDPGTLRRAYLYEGWSLIVRCDK